MAVTATVEVISTLNELIAVCQGGASGFRTAAENVKTTVLNAQFNSYAQQQEILAVELQAAVCRLEGDPRAAGGVPAIHRGWVYSRPTATGLDAAAITAECIRDEETALKSYTQALKIVLAPDIRAILDRQRQVIEESHRHLKALRERHTSGVTPDMPRRKTRKGLSRGGPRIRNSERTATKRPRPRQA